MPRLLRRRLLCFYCGGRSTQEYLPTIHLWQCEICDAPNHLDEKGEITDPPPLESLPQPRFAQPIFRATSPELAHPDESLFCQTCLQNQRFLTETLASYFPSSNDPEYLEYEKNYPEFRKNLEDRYPQVCRKCEPQVRNRIRITGYAAKTDHLRRMMERSRAGDRDYHRWTWKRLAVSTGAIGWYTSLAGQVLWDLGGALANEREDGLRDDDASSSILPCLARSWISRQPTVACYQQFDALAGLALGLGFLSIWWNPRFKEKLDRGGGRILGLSEYYKIQMIFLVIRCVSWAVFTRSLYDLDASTRRAMHSFLIMFSMISIVVSFRSVQLDLAPQVLFQDRPPPLISESQETGHNDRPQPGHVQSDLLKTRSAIPFSLNDLADHSQSRPLPYNPPTPPPDDDGIEEMDWTPSQQPLPPASKYRMPVPTIPQPSPFYGHLPPAPISQAHRLRNPPNQPTFRKASAIQKQSFFNRRLTHLEPDNVSEASSDCFDSPVKSIMKSEFASPEFAAPRFFPKSDYEMDTGLESIFSKAFSIAEEPHELRVARELKQKTADKQTHNALTPRYQGISLLTLAVSFLAWVLAPMKPHLTVPIRHTCLGVAAAVAIRGLLGTIQRDKEYWRWSDMFIYGFELGLATFLGSIPKLSPSDVTTDEINLVGIIFLGVMNLQELWIWISKPRNSAPVLSFQDLKPPPKALIPPTAKPTAVPKSTKIPKQKANSTAPPVAQAEQRTTRSKSRREMNMNMNMNTPAASGLGSLSLGGDNNNDDDEDAGMGSLTLNSRGKRGQLRRKL